MDMLLPPQQPSLASGSSSGASEVFLRQSNLGPSFLCFSSWPGTAAYCGVGGGLLRWGRSRGLSETPLGWRFCEGVESVNAREARFTLDCQASHVSATTTLTSASPPEEKAEKVPTLARMWEKFQLSEGRVVEEDLVIRVPSVQDRCARAGGSLFSQRNGWMNQDLLPILTSVRGPQSEADSLAPSPTSVSGAVDSDGADIRSHPPFDRPTISPEELRRLQRIGLPLKHHFKIGRAGVTDGVVQMMRNVWRNSELVKIRCHGPAAEDMREIVDDIERKTGGIIIWRAATVIIAYRGDDFVAEAKPVTFLSPELAEVDRILQRLGPRYEGWQGAQPAPVDGDMLGVLAPQYCKPLRLLPCGCKASLSSYEQTILRRAANRLPPHIVLGTPENLEGVAHAIIQLWEKCEVVRIDVKKDLAYGNLLEIAEELQNLTGGVIIAKHKVCFLLYRGQDFPPPLVAAALQARKATLL